MSDIEMSDIKAKAIYEIIKDLKCNECPINPKHYPCEDCLMAYWDGELWWEEQLQ